MDESTVYNDGRNPLLSLTAQASSGVSPLEQEVLDEYQRLLNNMNEASAKPEQRLSSTLASLSGGPMTLEIAEGLRLLERKVASVYTLMKASVYSIVLQQGQMEGDEGSAFTGDDEGNHPDGS